MDLSLKAITLWPEPTPNKGIFKLPWEIRQRIYELCLVQPVRYERIHSADCKYIVTDTHTCERPPFVDENLCSSPPHSCACSKRHSLNLLLANRQIYREAAPVLWSRNTFSFVHPRHFVDEVGQKLRPAHRLMLRHLSIVVYSNDSVPNNNHVGASSDQMWQTILQCNSLRTLELSHVLCHDQALHWSRIHKQLPQLESFRMVSLMAYRVHPRIDQSEPLVGGGASWRANRSPNNNDDDSDSDSDSDSDDDGFIPFADAEPAPPPPPPNEHYLVLRPYLAGYTHYYIRDFSRTLWFKTGIDIDLDMIAKPSFWLASLLPKPKRGVFEDDVGSDSDSGSDSGSDSDSDSDSPAPQPAAVVPKPKPVIDHYADLIRNFRTNFLVHVRHQIAKLPEAWARDYPPPRPYRALPRRPLGQYVIPGSEDPDDSRATWDPLYGNCLHHKDAISRVAERIPAHMRDGVAYETMTLRDGRTVTTQIMGLPISRELRTARFHSRIRTLKAKRAAGELTEEEAALELEMLQRRAAKHRTLRESTIRDASREMADRQKRNTKRERERALEVRVARAVEKARVNQNRDEVVAQRLAARKRGGSSGSHDSHDSHEGAPHGANNSDKKGKNKNKKKTDDNDNDDGNESSDEIDSDSDEEDNNKAVRRQQIKAARARSGGKKGSKNRKQGRQLGGKASRHDARAEITRRMRSGDYDD